MRRGEVWWADLPAPIGTRPVVLLTRDAAYTYRTQVTVAPVTRTGRGIPAEVSLGRPEGLPRDSVVSLDNITTIPKDLLRQRIAALTPTKLSEIDEAIHFALDLSY